jgi:hypothetical protein
VSTLAEGGKPSKVSREKTLKAKERTNYKQLDSHELTIEPRPQWREVTDRATLTPDITTHTLINSL